MNKLIILFALISCANACFTMPPKKTKAISSWRLTWTDLDSNEYIHDVHECPANYKSVLKYSHYIRENIGKTTIRYIMGYNVCCPH